MLRQSDWDTNGIDVRVNMTYRIDLIAPTHRQFLRRFGVLIVGPLQDQNNVHFWIGRSNGDKMRLKPIFETRYGIILRVSLFHPRLRI